MIEAQLQKHGHQNIADRPFLFISITEEVVISELTRQRKSFNQ